MSQNPLQNYVTNVGGSQSKLNQTAALQVKNSRGVLRRIVVAVAGSAGALTFNDLTSSGTPAAANQVLSLTNAQLNAASIAANGGPVVIDLPFLTGIMVSAIPTGSTLNYFYD